MKKIFIFIFVIAFMFSSVQGFADTTAFNVPVNVRIPMILELNYWIRSCPSDVGPYDAGSSEVTDMAFGKLTWDSTYRIWKADKYFTVFLVAMSSGRAYQIRQHCDGFNSPSTGQSLNENLVMTPSFEADDLWDAADSASRQGDHPSQDKVEAKSLSVGDNPIYTCSSGKGPYIVRCYYGFATGDPAANEPANAKVLTGQAPAGDYTGTILFTLTLV